MIGTKHVYRTLVAALAVVIVLATGCGVSNPAETASVSIDSVTTGCTDLMEAISVSDNFGSMTLNDVKASAEAAARAERAFADAPPEVGRYTGLIREAFVATVAAAEDRANLTNDQLPLLLQLEFTSLEAELAGVIDSASAYLEAQCGDGGDPAAFRAAAGTTGTGATGTETAAEAGTASRSTAATAVPTVTPIPTPIPTPTPAPTPTPVPVLVEETSSAGSHGRYLLVDVEVQGITRTNMDAEGVLQTGAGTPTEDEIVLVGVRLTSTGSNARFDLSAFQWVDAQGNSTAALASYDNGGAGWSPSVEANESRQGWLAFPASVGSTDGATLRVVRGSGVPENIPLGQGAAESPYPIDIEAGQSGSGVHNTPSVVCRWLYDLDVRGAQVTLDRFWQGVARRPEGSERWLNLNAALLVTDVVGGSQCPDTSTLYMNTMALRLRLDNGDTVAPFYFDGRAEGGATAITDIMFPIPGDTTAFELLDDEGTVLATWTDVSLPTP